MYVEITFAAGVGHIGGQTPVSTGTFSAPIAPEVGEAIKHWLAQVPQDLPRERITVTCILHNTNGQPITGGAAPITVG